jgi:hypothetical protein
MLDGRVAIITGAEGVGGRWPCASGAAPRLRRAPPGSREETTAE